MGSIVTKAAFLPPTPPNRVESPDLVFIETRSKFAIPVLHIRYKRNQNTHTTTPRFTLIYSHGNAEDLGSIQDWMYQLSRKLHIDIIAYDYVGYGLSHSLNKPATHDTSSSPSGLSHSTEDKNAQLFPSEQYCYESIDAVYNYALSQGITKDRLIVMGRSLGSGPTTDIASRKEVRAVVLQSPLLSAVRVVMKTLITLPIDIFANCDKIHKVKCPVFIMHGHVDNVVPFENGKKLYALVPDKYAYQPWWIEGASHNDIENKFYHEYLKRLRDYLIALEFEATPRRPIPEKDLQELWQNQQNNNNSNQQTNGHSPQSNGQNGFVEVSSPPVDDPHPTKARQMVDS